MRVPSVQSIVYMPPWSDAVGWKSPSYYDTMQAADVNGDGKAELLGRTSAGMETWGLNAATAQWQSLATGDCGFTDANGWNQAPYFATIQCADIDGDGQAELLGRGEYGIDTWKWDTTTSAWANVSTAQGDFIDSSGWNDVQYYTTIQCADVNGDGRAELLGRYSPGVETEAFDAATGGWQQIAPLISVDARLMENYVLAAPAATAGQYAVVVNAAGALEVLTIGADGNVYEIYPDPASDTGYSQAPVGVSAALLAAGLTDEGLLLVLAADGTSGTVSYVLSTPAGGAARWNAPATLAPLSGTVDALAAARLAGHLYVAALAGVTTGTQTTYTTYLAQWNSAAPSLGNSLALAPQPSAQAAVTALGTSLDANGTPTHWVVCGTEVWTQTLTGGTAYSPQPLPDGATVVCVTAATDAQARGHLYGVFSDGALYECSPLSVWAPVLAGGPALATVSGALNQQAAQVELYAAGQDARLRQILPATAEVTDLGIPATAARVGVDGDGNLTTFAAANALLTRVWQDADTTDWSTGTVDVSGLGQLQPVTTYTAELTIRDDEGLPRANEPVTIATSDPALLTVNGVTVLVDAQHPLATTADARGKVSVMTPASSLSAPLLVVTPAFVPDGGGLVVELNGAVQARLRAVAAGDLLDPVDMFGDPLSQPLLPGAFDNTSAATAIAGTVTQSMTLATPAADGGATSRIDRARVPEQHWRLRLRADGTATFTPLARPEAESVIAAHRASLEAGGILGIDWGDAWEAVREGVGAIVDEASDLLDITVSTVAGGITVAATWLIDTVQRGFNGLIELVEQAFDIVEGIFESIGVAFGTLVEWLGFLFNWTDISRTAQAVSFLYGQCLELLPGAIGWLQTELTTMIDQYGSQIAQLFDNLAASVSGQNDAVTLASSVGPPPAELTYSNANNIMLTGTLTNAGSATSLSSTASRALDPSPIEELIQQLKTYADQFEAGDGWSNAVDYFAQMAQQLPSQPDQALRSALAGMIEVLGALGQLALETASLVVNAVLGTLGALIEAVTDALQMQWEIPFVSQLYQWATGTNDPLTPVGLAALLVAIPVTVFSKLTTGAAPFPDDAALAQFQSTFTAQAILQSLPTAGNDAVAAPAPAIPSSSLQVVYLVGLITDSVFQDMSALADLFSNPPISYDPKPYEIIFSGMIVVAEAAAVVCACPAWALTSRPVIEWVAWGLCAVLPVTLDAVWFAFARGIPQLGGDEGVVASFLAGLVSLLMTAAWMAANLITGSGSWLSVLAAFLGSLPLIFKILRLRSIEEEKIGPVPVSPFNRCALALVDTLAGTGSAIAAYYSSLNELNKDLSAAAALA